MFRVLEHSSFFEIILIVHLVASILTNSLSVDIQIFIFTNTELYIGRIDLPCVRLILKYLRLIHSADIYLHVGQGEKNFQATRKRHLWVLAPLLEIMIQVH